MKYTDLIEASDSLSDEEIKMAKLIKRDCQPYLRQNAFSLKQLAMYRGLEPGEAFTEQYPTVIHKDIRLNDRKVSDTDPLIHDFFNIQFTKLYGAPFRNSMFANGNAGMVFQYGRVYIVFPIGEFKFLWSDVVDDLYVSISNETWNVFPNGVPETHKLRDSLKPEQALYKYLNPIAKSYRTDDLMSAIASSKEIMIRGSSYYGIAKPKTAGTNTSFLDQLHEIIYS